MPSILRAKCVIVGDSYVGKSAISQVFHSDNTQFPKNYTMTTGVEILTKILNVPETHSAVEFFVFDMSGKDAFAERTQKLWSNASMVIVVYDVTNGDSFTSVESWLEKVRPQKQTRTIPGVLIANKTDLDGRRVVSQKDGENLALSKGLTYFECSAKEMKNVDQPFLHLAKTYLDLYEKKLDSFKSLG